MLFPCSSRLVAHRTSPARRCIFFSALRRRFIGDIRHVTPRGAPTPQGQMQESVPRARERSQDRAGAASPFVDQLDTGDLLTVMRLDRLAQSPATS